MKKTLAIMLALIMVLALVPTVAFAETYVAWIGETGYETLEAAVNAAESGATITLGEGEYTLYEKNANVLNKDLTFVGQGADKTTYHIGAKDTSHSDGPCDYSLDGRGTDMKETVTFKDMTIDAGKYPKEQTERAHLHGLAGIDNIVLDNCTFNGIASYWGYATTKFNNVIFNAPGTEASEIKGVDYSLWTWTGTEYTFNNCTFNSAGKVINVYHEDPKIATTINFNNCTVNSTNPDSLSVMNINDTYVQSFTINFTGNNTINDIKADGIQVTGGSHASDAKDTTTGKTVKKTSEQATCSKLFEFNMKYGNGNNGKTTVNIDGTPVWTGGKMLRHAIDTPNDKYTDGYKDKAFTVTPNGPGSFVVTCVYCGYTETSNDGLYNDIGLARTVNQNSNLVSEDAVNSNKYKVANSSGITVDYTATMDMTKLKWEKQGSLSAAIPNPWQMLATQPDWITEDTVVFLKFTFDKNINLGTFQTNYNNNATTTEAKEKLLKLESNMFKIADEGGVQFDIENREMTIKCNWNWNKEAGLKPDPTITLKGCGLPVVKDNWGGSKIDIENRGCVSGTVHIKYINPKPDAKMIAETVVPNVVENVQVQNTTPPEISPTIQIPIVGGCAADKFTLYYGGGSSGDSSGGSSSGGGYYHPTTTPVPVIVIPPKTGDMTVWQSILHFLGIR